MLYALRARRGEGGEMVDELDSKYVFKETTERELAALCIALRVHRALNLVCCLLFLPRTFRMAGTRWPKG